MGVRGIARDLAAAGLGTLKPLAVPAIEGSFDCPVEIRTDDPDGCLAFFGRVIRGLSNGPAPEWVQRRLKAAGQRPISALVDLTNYVMLDLGRPAHAYDLATLSGAVVARQAVTSCDPVRDDVRPPHDWAAEHPTPAERLAELEREKAGAVARDARSPGEPPEWTAYREAKLGAARSAVGGRRGR